MLSLVDSIHANTLNQANAEFCHMAPRNRRFGGEGYSLADGEDRHGIRQCHLNAIAGDVVRSGVGLCVCV